MNNIDDLVFEFRLAAIQRHNLDSGHTGDWANCDFSSCVKAKSILEKCNTLNESTARFITSEEAGRTDAASGNSCPKCGGSLPTCCSCPLEHKAYYWIRLDEKGQWQPARWMRSFDVRHWQLIGENCWRDPRDIYEVGAKITRYDWEVVE